MISITNGKKTMEVSRGSFESIYKCSGWTEIDKSISSNKNEEAKKNSTLENKERELRKEELRKIPVGELTKAQLKEAATIFGIAFKDKTQDEVRQEVAKAFSEEE